MRGKAMAFGIFLVVTGVCLLEILSGEDSVLYFIGAGVGMMVTSVYGYGVYLQIGENRAAAARELGGRKKKF